MLPGFDKLCYSQQVTGDKSQATPDYTPRATLLASSREQARSATMASCAFSSHSRFLISFCSNLGDLYAESGQT